MSGQECPHSSPLKQSVGRGYPCLIECVNCVRWGYPCLSHVKKKEDEKTIIKNLCYILHFTFHIHTHNSLSHPHFTFHFYVPCFTFHIHISHSTFHFRIPYFKLYLIFHISLLRITFTFNYKIVPK